MAGAHTFPNLSEPELLRLAQEVAFALRPGDLLALEGDLGAGKTTFARAVIQALAADAGLEIPSPTFTLVQPYTTPRFDVAHFDLYRLAAPDELAELGLEDALANGVAIVEWPERGAERLPRQRLTLSISETLDPSRRDVELIATSTIETRLSRLLEIRNFLARAGWGGPDTAFQFLQGDASARRYARLVRVGGQRAILMDSPKQPDGPPVRNGLPYSRIAHLAEDVRPFVAVGTALRQRGFRAPEVYAFDLDAGLLLIEDLGDHVFGTEVARGASQEELWERGVDTLATLRRHPPDLEMRLPDQTTYRLPLLDRGAFEIEAELLVDWYWPALHGKPVPEDVRTSFLENWRTVFARLDQLPKGWLLRDYHSPNLIALDARDGSGAVGIIDFQDALLGPEAYDLVSLLQDARVDVPVDIEMRLLDRYVLSVLAGAPGFDEMTFRFSYAALGAQRNTKILGIFARLAQRDGKRQYLAHVPRLWNYLARDLAHPDLARLEAWYDRHFPLEVRSRTLAL